MYVCMYVCMYDVCMYVCMCVHAYTIFVFLDSFTMPFDLLQVTWIRHRDVHILTVGEYTYTTDERFVGRHTRETDEWVLIIKYVQERDAGIYECQIPAATPKSYPVNLNIVGKYPAVSLRWLTCFYLRRYDERSRSRELS